MEQQKTVREFWVEWTREAGQLALPQQPGQDSIQAANEKAAFCAEFADRMLKEYYARFAWPNARPQELPPERTRAA